jgi:hypothetical protein
MLRSTMHQVEDESDSVTEIDFVHLNGLSSDFGEPKTFKEAWDGTEGEKWKPSMGSEVMNFLNIKAWTKITKEKATKTGKKILKVKRVFKKMEEQDSLIHYKSRIATKGYLQIPGVDYTEYFAPIEAAFLKGEFDEPMYKEFPKGMDELGFIKKEEMQTHCI